MKIEEDEETAAIRANWVSLLRSGVWWRIPGGLASTFSGSDEIQGMCCLGVLCASVGVPPENLTNRAYIEAVDRDYNLLVPHACQRMLSFLNDECDWTFNQIADLIEGRQGAVDSAIRLRWMHKDMLPVRIIKQDLPAVYEEFVGAGL